MKIVILDSTGKFYKNSKNLRLNQIFRLVTIGEKKLKTKLKNCEILSSSIMELKIKEKSAEYNNPAYTVST